MRSSPGARLRDRPSAEEEAMTSLRTAAEPVSTDPVQKRAPSRVVIEGVEPEIDGGRFPVKRTAGEEVVVGADIFTDGHDLLAAVLRYRHARSSDWVEVPMSDQGNDRWTGSFFVTDLGRY